MTLLKPTLQISRLVVFQNSHRAFDCAFHHGVNVVRGRNSSGKTTVMDFLAFSLGSENIRWKPEALQCTQTIAEVQLNGRLACLGRDIGVESQKPMYVFWGSFEAAMKASRQQWERYPFRRTEHQVSFSQVIFGALEMPVAQGDGASNLTLHQIVRVLYADQPSVHSPIFRDDHFDSALTREMVGSYLSGVYDEELYSSQLRSREVTVQLGKYEAELKGIFSVLGRSGQTPDLIYTGVRILELEAVREELTRKLIQLKLDRTLPRKDANKTRAKADDLRQQLSKLRVQDAEIKDQLAALELDQGDSLMFVRELQERLANLDESKETRSYFGKIKFKFCPSCLMELKDDRTADNHCNLCTSALTGGSGDAQVLRMRNELSIQLKESTNLLESRAQTTQELRQQIPIFAQQVKQVEREYAVVASSWSSEVETALEEMSRKLGVLDEEIKQAYEKQKLASVVADLQERRDKLTAELSGLEDRIGALKLQQQARQAEVNSAVEQALVRLLRLDLPLQPEFLNAQTATFSFTNNTVWINDSRNFSESSAVVLRHLFHLALLTASTQKPFMRVPRLMILDGIDDGGMEKERSHKLQEIIVNECRTYKVDYQLIFATSEINPALEGSNLVVGRAFTPDSRSLDVRSI